VVELRIAVETQVGRMMEDRGIVGAGLEEDRRMSLDAGVRRRKVESRVAEGRRAVGDLHKLVAGDVLLRHRKSRGNRKAENGRVEAGSQTVVYCAVEVGYVEEVVDTEYGLSRLADKRLEVQILNNHLAGYYPENNQSCFLAAAMNN
jgi:hypothetical protein